MMWRDIPEVCSLKYFDIFIAFNLRNRVRSRGHKYDIVGFYVLGLATAVATLTAPFAIAAVFAATAAVPAAVAASAGM